MRRRRMPGDELAHGFIDQWPEGFLAGLVAADHFLFARLDDAGVLRAAAAWE